MQSKNSNENGLSIIEILVALAVVSILFTVVARAIGVGGKGLATIISHSELLEDTRYAGEIIHSNLQNAVYVYPPQTELKLNANAEFHTRNPRTSSNTWVIGQDPILAMITAPKSSATTCPTDPNACLSFVAYYTVKRSEVTSSAGLSYTGGGLPSDQNNPDALMIFEYQKTLNVPALDPTNSPPLSNLNDSPAGQLENVTARLVADYISPNQGFFIDPNTAFCQIGGAMFSSRSKCPIVGETALLTDFENTMVAGSLRLTALYNKGRKTYQTPELEFSFNPRNLY